MRSRSAWLSYLAALSPAVAQLNVSLPEVEYRDATSGRIAWADAYNFCGDSPHNKALARCLETRNTKGMGVAALKKYLTDLTSGNQTYGTLCELLVYDWLDENGIPFDPQIPVTGREILNPSGSDLDGRFTISSDIYFDIKGFGFQEMMIARLKERLEADLPGSWISVEENWDVSVEALQGLLEPLEYEKLRSDLANTTTARRGVLNFVRREPKPVQISTRVSDPYAQAEEHASYVFRFAKQFTRSKPFILIFAYHPWLGGSSLNTDFAYSTSTYTRALARRTFIQFLQDVSPVFDLTKGAASRLVSGIGFLNISHLPKQPKEGSGSRQPEFRLYINPNAANPIPEIDLDAMRWGNPPAISVDSFRYDNY